MAAGFLPIAILVSLLAAGAMADGYGSSSPSTPVPYTPTPAKPSPTPTPYTPTTPPKPSPYTPPPAPKPAPYTPPAATPKPAPYTPPAGEVDKKKLVVVRVEGLVVCQSCEYRGSWNLEGGAPLPGAKVVVTCRGRKNRVMAYRKPVADAYGYFHAEFGVQPRDRYLNGNPRDACVVRLLASPDAKCNVVTNIQHGAEGALVRDEGKRWTDRDGVENAVYAAGPLAFRPAFCRPPRHY